MSRMISAQLRGDLEERYEAVEADEEPLTKSDFLREVVDEGLHAKETDVLDAIGGSDELRAAVEARREEGEPLEGAVRRLLREGTDANSGARATGGPVALAVAASLLGAGLSLLFAGEATTGWWLSFGGAFAALNYFLFRAFGWGAWFWGVVDDVRDGLRDVGGVRGFLALVWERWRRGRAVEDPATPVERAANVDVYIPVLVVVGLALGGVGWGIIQAGLLPLIGPPGALVFAVLLTAVMYAFPAAMLVSSVAMLAIASAAGSDGVDTGEEDLSTDG